MPAEVKILVEGQTNANEVGETGEEKTRPTITLVKEGNLNMVVDPGILESQQILVDALKREGLSPADINVVCITHSHIDHYRNIGMFPFAKALDYYGLWDKESVQQWQENFSTNIQVLHTPGHDKTGITIFAKTESGIVAVCGDIFWSENYPEDAKDDLFASDPEKLEESRRLVLEKADWIVPGHGQMFKANKELLDVLKKEEVSARKKKIRFLSVCRKCGSSIQDKKNICICRPYLCYRCCECGIDCDTCNCSHRGRRRI